MALDFRTNQIQVNKVIATGSTGLNAQLVVYGGVAASDGAGGIGSKFVTTSIGSDVFLFVSGGAGKGVSGSYAMTVFGGDTMVSGGFTTVGTAVFSGSRTLYYNTTVPGSGIDTFVGDVYMSGTTWRSIQGTADGDERFVFQSGTPDKALMSIRSDGAADTIDVIRYSNPYVIVGSESRTWHSGTKIRGKTVTLEGTQSGSVSRATVELNSDSSTQNNNYVQFNFYDSGPSTVAAAHTFAHLSDHTSYYTIGHPGTLGAPLTAIIQARSASAGGSDTPGASLTMRPGAGLGTGYSKLTFQASPPTGSGTNPQTYTDVAVVAYFGFRLVGGPVASRTSASNSETPGTLYYGSDQQRLLFQKGSEYGDVYVSAKVVTSASLNTTSSTPALIASVSLAVGTAYNIDAIVLAKSSSHAFRGRWLRNLVVYRSASSDAAIDSGQVYAITTDITGSAWNIGFATSGSLLQLYVTGAASPVSWSCNLDVMGI